jgi:hypothetical protein
MIRPLLLLLLATLATLSAGCRRRRVALRALHARQLFARVDAGGTRIERWLARDPLASPFLATIDGQAAVLDPSGTLRWVTAGSGTVAVREARSPCRFDPSRHALRWTLAPRLALDGRGHACCVHDGDDAAPAGAFCGDLREAEVRWRRARTPGVPTGVGSGEGAIALFATDVWCTRDGGASVAVTFRGDPAQPLSGASCADGGDVVAMGGTRSPGAVRLQTLRAARAGGPLVRVADVPRGEPVDLRAGAGGAFAALLATGEGPRYVARDAQGRVEVVPLAPPAGVALGGWGRGLTVLVAGGAVHARGRGGEARARALEGEDAAALVAATRVGASLVGVTRDGALAVLDRE